MWVAQGRSTTHSVKLRANFAAASFVRVYLNVCNFASRKSHGCAFTYHCVVYTPRTPSPQATGQLSKPWRLQDACSRGSKAFLFVNVFFSFERLKTVQPSPLDADSKRTLGPAQAKSASGHHSRTQPTIDSLQLASAYGGVVHAMRIGLKREQREEALDLLPRRRATYLQRGRGLDDATKAQWVCCCETRTVLDLLRSAAYSVHALDAQECKGHPACSGSE